jgi:hypothetical protein
VALYTADDQPRKVIHYPSGCYPEAMDIRFLSQLLPSATVPPLVVGGSDHSSVYLRLGTATRFSRDDAACYHNLRKFAHPAGGPRTVRKVGVGSLPDTRPSIEVFLL